MNETPQTMTILERENLKFFARRMARNCDAKSLADTLVMIAHWMRQRPKVAFSDYASNWVAANPFASDAMRAEWPLTGPRRIATRYSDWDSDGDGEVHDHYCPRAKVPIEMQRKLDDLDAFESAERWRLLLPNAATETPNAGLSGGVAVRLKP